MENFVGKRIIVFFDDSGNVSRKQGKCTAYSDNEVVLDNKDIIPKVRIIRMEVLGDNNE